MRLALCIGLGLFLGCGPKEEVRRYKAPKDPTWRTLAAFGKAGGSTWFFKVTGPAEHVASYRDEVLGFLKGVKAEGSEVRWTLPAGWEEGEAKKPDRAATLTFGERPPRQEMAITRLEGEAGGLGPNINRWRGQLGLEPSAEAETKLQKIDVPGMQLSFVDLEGPKRPAAPQAMRPPADHPEPPPRPRRNPREMFTFTLPAGWKESDAPQASPRILEILADGGVKVSLSGMPGDGGGLGPNINRWRGQAGLEPLDDEAARAQAKPFRFLETDGWLAEMPGPSKAIVVALAIDSQLSLFLKMEGSPAAVASQRSPFEALAASMRMEGGHD